MNTSRKTIVLLNSEKQFRIPFIETCNQEGVEVDSFKTRRVYFLIKDKKVELYRKGKLCTFENKEVFLRLLGSNPSMAALVTEYLHLMNVPCSDVVSNRTESVLSSKLAQMISLTLNGLTVPDSVIATEISFKESEENIVKEIGFPCVLKTPGAKGKCVWKIETQEELSQKIEEIKSDVFLIQKYVENTYDIRSFVYKDDHIVSIKRSSADGFYNNLSQGGSGEVVELTEYEQKEVVTAAAACQLDFAGTDIIRTEDGPVILEVNKSPQVMGFDEVVGFDIAAKVAEYICNTN